MKSKHLLRVVSLLVLMVSLFPSNAATALTAQAVPPVNMFQLPWDQGIAWVAIDGIDNGSKRPLTSSHNYSLGGAIDFAPKSHMVTGENTSTYWVTAAAAGTVIEISSCHMKIAHASGWLTEYQFLGNIQVKLGDTVARNQRLGIIADGVKYKYCAGSQEINVPHLHFMLRPSIIGASFAGWEVGYNRLFNYTFFRKNGSTVSLFKPLLNVFDSATTPTPTDGPPSATPTGSTPTGGTPTSTAATSTPTPIMSPTPTVTGPYVSTSSNPREIRIGESALVTVSLNNVPAEGYNSAEFTCTYNAGLFVASNILVGSLFGPDPATAINQSQDHSFIVAVAGSKGSKATTSGPVFTFNIQGMQVGQTVIECRARVSQGSNALTEIPFVVDYVAILGSTPTPDLTPSFTPTPSPASITDVPTDIPIETLTSTPTPFPPNNGWLTFTDLTYGFQFQYPQQSTIDVGGTDDFTRINLPVVPGTNLGHKYLEMTARANSGICQSPLATRSGLHTSENVIINGIAFLKQTGADGSAGHINKWTAYSTSRENACVTLDFIMRIADPGNFATPVPLFDEAAESAVFGQIMSTYTWLALPSTSTPTPTFVFTPNPTLTVTPLPTSTPVASLAGTVNGQVLASKFVTIILFNLDNSVAQTLTANSDGTFSLTTSAGTYNLVATASGFLSAQGPVTITAGGTVTKPGISLLAGDIDSNNVINQFDVLTLGMSYNTSTPTAADLNSDGIINVLDLELLAKNYLKSGAIIWQ